MILLPGSIPSPEQGVWMLGPIPIRGYAVMILIGMIAGLFVANRRWQDRGGRPGTVYDVAMWAIPFGIVGARLYHVITDWQKFEGNWGDVFKIWEGGLGILGGVILGAVAGLAYLRRHGIAYSVGLAVVAPAVPLAQAIGSWGN